MGALSSPLVWLEVTDRCLKVEELSDCRTEIGAARHEGLVSLLEYLTQGGGLKSHRAGIVSNTPLHDTQLDSLPSRQLLHFHFYLRISIRLSLQSLQPDISS